MRAVGVVLWAEARYRWRSLLALALLVALVSGVVMAGATAGRRVSSAFPRYLATYGYDALGYSFGSLPGLDAIPQVQSSVHVSAALSGPPRCRCQAINPNDFSVLSAPAAAEPHLFKLVSGHAPDPGAPDQVLASFTFAQQSGLHVGSVLRVPFFGRDQMAVATGASNAGPAGPTVDLRVVGIEAAEFEFPSVGTPTQDLWTTPAFERVYGPRVLNFAIYLVRLRHGAADQATFQAAAKGALGFTDEDVVATAVETSLHPQAVGWWVLAGLAALAGILSIAQAMARQTRVAGEAAPTLAAIGLDSRQLVALSLGRAAVVSVLGALGGIALAVALSPFTLVGEARIADPSTGLFVDPVVLGLGGAAVLVVTMAVSLWPAVRAARLSTGRSTVPWASSGVVNRLAAAGAPPAAVVGVRRALERGQGRSAVPVGTALVGTALAVLALSATAVFGESLTHLTATPALYGQRFDAYFNSNSGFGQPSIQTILARVSRDRQITVITLGASLEVTIDHRSVDAIAGTSVRGPLLLSPVTGRLPAQAGEVALGATTLRELGVHLGSVVEVAVPRPGGGTGTATFHVVGTVTLPVDFGVGGLGNGAAFTIAGLVAAQCGGGPGSAACVRSTTASETLAMLIAALPTRTGRAEVTALEHRYADEVTIPFPPTNLVNFGEAVNFPFIIGVVLALFGAAVLLHTLLVSTRRRRTETGLLKALGFQRRQLVAAVGWQATTIALVGAAVGIPAGIAVGEAVWRLFAETLGVVPQPVVAGWALGALAAAVLVLANLLAVAPAVVASRVSPAELLRTA